MTLRQSDTLLRALVALALGFGFVGFATHSHTVRDAHAAVGPEASALETVDTEATPVADATRHAGI